MITSEHIQQFINYKITNGLSPTSVRNIVVLLERILRYGEDENLLPVTKRSFTFPKSSFYINDTLDASQLSILARYLYLEGDVFSVGLLLCMHTGIRIGELCGLKGGDFNFTNETFEIHRTISRIRNTESTPDHQDAKTKVIIGTPKSTSSLRTIPVPRQLLSLLKRQHPAATDPYKPEPHRYDFERDGTEGIRKTQKENLVYKKILRKKRFYRAGTRSCATGGELDGDDFVWEIL